ncbi:MAG: hypothetical protein DHS20C17_23030 [Cyclobacteriaceae bacterium]|nr:MAG: hypothetical protein DHS20C17_23030 [Cyclobacteriaceae bacterium]
MAIAGIFTEARAQQQPLLDPANAIAFNEFFRLLVPPEDVEERANLFTDWQQGAVFLSQGRFASDITFNYDVLNNTLLVQVDEKKYSLNPIAVDSILVANRAQVLINPIILEGIGSDLLLLRLYNGLHLSLFRNNLAAVIDSDNRTSSIAEIKYTGDSDVRIALEQKYLLLNKDTNELREVLGKKKELKKWENGDQILTFIKNQNLDFSNEDDLIQVVQYYEQLNYGDID